MTDEQRQEVVDVVIAIKDSVADFEDLIDKILRPHPELEDFDESDAARDFIDEGVAASEREDQ